MWESPIAVPPQRQVIAIGLSLCAGALIEADLFAVAAAQIAGFALADHICVNDRLPSAIGAGTLPGGSWPAGGVRAMGAAVLLDGC